MELQVTAKCSVKLSGSPSRTSLTSPWIFLVIGISRSLSPANTSPVAVSSETMAWKTRSLTDNPHTARGQQALYMPGGWKKRLDMLKRVRRNIDQSVESGIHFSDFSLHLFHCASMHYRIWTINADQRARGRRPTTCSLSKGSFGTAGFSSRDPVGCCNINTQIMLGWSSSTFSKYQARTLSHVDTRN